MDSDLQMARKILENSSCSCVLCKGPAVYKSHLRGVKPLLQMLESKTDVTGFSVADRVVGQAAAFLYCLLGVQAVYGTVISRGALQVLESHGIRARYRILTDRILNRNRDGFCPLETAVADADSPETALQAIYSALKGLR